MSTSNAIAIVDYDEAWPLRFEELAAKVRVALGNLALRVEHVGSTAVPGLAAKPIIDLDVVVGSPADLESIINGLAEINYVHEGDLGIKGREAFRSPAGDYPHHLYVLIDGAAELKRHLAFRDALRADPALRAAYARLKRSLADRYPNDRSAYSRGKFDFVGTIVRHT